MRMFFSILYRYLLKPILFLHDPEEIHNLFTFFGNLLGKSYISRKFTELAFAYSDESLEQNIGGIDFLNPIGLSAGFDYDGKMTSIMPSVGFGFESMGTVTFSSYEGNKKPRLGRLPKSKSLLVNKGFKSEGIERVLNKHAVFVNESFNLGISVGATNSPETSTPELQIEDIWKSVDLLKQHCSYEKFAYLEVNISCPNVLGAGSLATPEHFGVLLKGILNRGIDKPIWIKFPIEISWKEAIPLLDIMVEQGVSAVVIGNLLKKRDPNMFDREELELNKHNKGNFSGKPTWKLSNALIAETYKAYGEKISIVGVGGVFSAEDAYHKIQLGASLVELITGMIYGGPQLIGGINSGLVKLMKRDGFGNISEAVGTLNTSS